MKDFAGVCKRDEKEAGHALGRGSDFVVTGAAV